MVGELLSNTYRVKRLIGRGGMGEVYEATHERTGASFAIKVLLADFRGKEDLLARFQREAEITSRLRHPNIVKVFDFDKLPDGRPFLAMEMLQGQPLDAILVRGQPMPIARVADIVDQVGLALAAAHDAGVVHRDLKPGNLFVEMLAGSDRELLRVLDFGISKVRDSGRLTHTSTIMGTPYYMSPEQATGRSREIDSRSDQFAFAAIVYELITGRLAFGADEVDGDEVVAAMYRVVHTEPPGFAALGIDLPPEIEEVVRRGLAKKPADRFQSVSAFSSAFARAARKLVDQARDNRASEAVAHNRQTAVLSLGSPGPVAAAAKTTPLPRSAPIAGQTLPMPTTLRSVAGERLPAESMVIEAARRPWIIAAAAGAGLVAAAAVLIWSLGSGHRQGKVADLSVPAKSPATDPVAPPTSPQNSVAQASRTEPSAVLALPPKPLQIAPPPGPALPPAVPPTSIPASAMHTPDSKPLVTKKPKKPRSPPAVARPNEDIF